MGHHHVPEGARLLVERTPGADREGLGDVDLDVVDVLPVPDGLEQPVGEPEGQDVLGRLLPEEVVDAEHLVLVEDLLHGGVQPLGAAEVGTEGLLHDDAGPFDEPGVGQGAYDRVGGVGRDAEVVQAPRFGVQRCLRLPDRLGQAGGPT